MMAQDRGILRSAGAMPVAYQKQFGQYQALAAKAHESIKNSIFVQIPDTGHIRIWKARTSSTRMSFRFSRGLHRKRQEPNEKANTEVEIQYNDRRSGADRDVYDPGEPSFTNHGDHYGRR
jgi:hypothetical protein